MSKNHYDYIIIGNGLAGLQLAIGLSEDPYFKDKQIALIDPSTKTENDKTWSFWEKESTKWNNVTCQSWHKAKVYGLDKTIDLNLTPYTYKSIRAIEFYTDAKAKLTQKANIHFLVESVTEVSEDKTVTVTTKDNNYTAQHVFDSRIPKDFSAKAKNYTTLIQHFKGVVIKTKDNVFDKNVVTMMDYRLKDGEQTTFMYVLPFSENEALVEFTYFTEHTVEESVYDNYIKVYIKDFLKIENYSIIETEGGQIPMTTFPFTDYNTDRTTKIGTAGGWVKASTGYSFKHTQKKVKQIITNLKSDQNPTKNLFKSKYKFYDKIFLQVLKDENHKGEWIFTQYYKKNKTETMFRFLDEDSTFIEDLKIMWSLFSFSFIKAFFKTL